MARYGTEEFEAVLADLESDLVERKTSMAGDVPTKIRQAVCAFANDLPDHRKPGVVFVGACDDGKPSGITIDDSLLTTLAAIKTDGNIVPPPTITVSKEHLSGADVAVLTVLPADSPPVRYKGRIWIRTGPRRDLASEQEERILNERRRYGDRPFDVQPVPTATLADLDRGFFEGEYLPAAIPVDVLEANDRTFEQRLAASKMIVSTEDPRPTVVGILVLSPRCRDFLPGALIQFLRIQGTRIEDPIIDESAIDGRLADIIRRVDEKTEAHIRTSIDISTRDIETRHSSYPKGALQQLIRNALMHRTYEATNAPVRVTWYDDRIEIVSPGGPFGLVRPENFGEPGVTDYRNPSLAEAMRVFGFVQRFGVGIATARRLLAENGNPELEFSVQATLVQAALKAIP